MQTLRLASFQRQPHYDDVPASTAQLLTDLHWCDTQKVELALFPECYLQGYATDRPTIAARAWDLRGAQFREFLSLFATVRCSFILGLIEQRDGHYYNSAVVIQAGRLLGSYAKTHPNEPGFAAGTAYPVFAIKGCCVGINICNDANYAQAAIRLSEQGAHLICYPLNNMLSIARAEQWRHKHLENLQQRAIDTACWVVSSDVVGHIDAQTGAHIAEPSPERIAYGCTSLIRPDGSVAARVPESREDALLFDLG